MVVREAPAPTAWSRRLETTTGASASVLQTAEENRSGFVGECSYQSMITTTRSTARATMTELLKQSGSADVVVADSRDSLEIAEIDLSRIGEARTGDIRIQIA